MAAMAKEPKKPKLSKPPPSYTPAQLRTLRERLDLTQEQAAAKVGVSRRTWAGWEGGEVKPPKPLLILIQLLDQEKL